MKIKALALTELIRWLHYILDAHIRPKRHLQNKDSNASKTFTRKEIQMACTI